MGGDQDGWVVTKMGGWWPRWVGGDQDGWVVAKRGCVWLEV